MKTIIFTKQKTKPSINFYRNSLISLILFFVSFNLFGQTTVTFDYTGAEQTWIVPSGVTSVEIETWGAQGGAGAPSNPGGKGGYAKGDLTVTPGQTLYIYVGGMGAVVEDLSVSGGGFNGGGNARGDDFNELSPRGAGGGASDVRIGGNLYSNRVIVAGGGGGSAQTLRHGGAGGGLEGGYGIGTGNSGGTQTSGGEGSPGNTCEAGSFGLGGSSSAVNTCSGGGGGWYGGASGAAAGGGSGYIGGVNNGEFASGARSGDGLVLIHYNSNNAENDFCSDAIPIYCSQTHFDNTQGVGIDNPPSCGVDVGTSGGLWYSFTGTGENVTFSTCSSVTDFNTQISVYLGTCDELICVDANDDAPGCGEKSKLTISTVEGAFYYILVNGANGEEGIFSLSAWCPPVNDEPENATSILCGQSPIGVTCGASSAPAGLASCGLQNGIGGAVWYVFEGDGGCATVSTCDPYTDFNTQLTVFRDDQGSLICVDANNDDGNCSENNLYSTVNFPTLPDTDYYIMVHGVGPAEGVFTLSLTCELPPLEVTCPPDVDLACGETLPEPASMRPGFIAQGGSIEGGSCVTSNYGYSITHQDLVESDCDLTFIERVYHIVNTITEQEIFCSQNFTVPTTPVFTIECSPDVNVICADDIFVSEADVAVISICPYGYTVDINGPIVSGNPNCSGATYTYEYTVVMNGCEAKKTCERTFTIVNNGVPEIACPADITVSCEDEINLDPNDAIVAADCNADYFVYIRNPTTSGAPGCNGTMYKYEYVVVDGCGNKASCFQTVTISNAATTINVPAGGVVECFEDIDISLSDATVTNNCADYNLYLTSPEINGDLGCPGSVYTYTYRMIDVCGNVVEEDVVFTNADNEAPSIVAPIDITSECLAGINPNPDHATITTGCTVGSNVTVSGPQIIGALDCPGTQYIYTYTVSDNCGRTASDVQIVTVQNSGPVFLNCEEDIWLQFNCEDYGGEQGTIAVLEAYIASVEAYSSCGGQLEIFNDFNPNDINTCINNGISTITFFATDNCGRTSTCVTTYVVVDTEAPVIFEDAQDHWEICNYNSPANFQDWVANHGNAEAFDECANDNFSWSTIPANPTFNCMGASGVTSVSVTFVATDNCGNSSMTTATFNAFMNGNGFVGETNDESEINKNTEAFTLSQNRPNPFSEETIISFYLPEASEATLTIFDINGKVQKVIQDNYNDGFNEVSLSKSDFNTVGVFYYQLMTKQKSVTKSMIVVE